eukprot:3543989-Alexandrium_andersonii.AAC.1
MIAFCRASNVASVSVVMQHAISHGTMGVDGPEMSSAFTIFKVVFNTKTFMGWGVNFCVMHVHPAAGRNESLAI